MLSFCVRQLIDRISQAFFGLRFRLLLLVLLACAPLVALTLHTASRERRRAVAAWSERAQTDDPAGPAGGGGFARTDPPTAAGSVGVVRGAVGRTRHLQEVTGAKCSPATPAMPTWVWPTPTARSWPAPSARPSPAIRLTASSFVACSQRAPSRSAATRSVFTNGKPAVILAVLFSTGPTSVQAVVFATLELDWLAGARSELSAQVPKGATWTEIDRNGTILVRYPASGLSCGQPFPDRALVRTVLSQPDGIVEAPDSSGIPAFCAFAWRDSQLVPGRVATLLSMPKRILFAERIGRCSAV